MINLGDAVLFFKGDLSDLDKALGDARQASESSLGNMKQLAFEAGAALTAMGGAILGGLGVAVTQFANAGDEINDMSKKIGFSTEEVSRWKFALGQSGGSIDLLQTGVRGLANQLQAAKQATTENTGEVTATNDAFSRLGISLTELSALSPEQQFTKMALAVAAIPDPMERAATAQDVFGKAGMDLLPVLSAGEAGLREMFDQAERAGAVFSQQEADLADAYNDAIGELGAAASGAGKEIAIALIPDLIELIGHVRDTVIGIKEWAQANPELFSTLTKVGGVIGGLAFVLGPILVVLPGIVTAVELVGPAFAAIIPAIMSVVGAISWPVVAIVAAVVAIAFAAYEIYENWDAIKDYFSDFWNNLQKTFNEAAEAIKNSETWQSLKETTTEWTEYAVHKMGEFAGWVGTNFAQAITDPVGFIKEYWAWLGESIDAIVLQVGKAVDFVMTNILEPAWDWMKEMYSWLKDVFLQGFNEGWNNASSLPDAGTETPPPAFASGTLSAPGGLAWVGEEGPELVNLPRGAQVIPAAQSAAMAGGATINIHMGGVTLPNRAMVDEFNRSLGDEISRRLSLRGLQPRLA